ncbi:hypothetical protein SAMN04487895_106221 [Paenibacillus sophorae]|uniref:Helix-turn-helix domain-containing protein n=1 Tax=Paenibacillus sophorae TaxID=1333845 RepID=A0A1H8NG83_9BACL|nr:hypothetical protein [Paenibacillus sophorae]QWU14633.1 hypothetical protein KP014_22305 [Paenibacillus sophorae]SEO28586.1 hypothetical protein SAMN04487895_106221 [Paenibacillus sophorae]
MDKSKVIDAYRRGFITVKECGQILGVEDVQLQLLLRQELSKVSCMRKSRHVGG